MFEIYPPSIYEGIPKEDYIISRIVKFIAFA